MNAPVEDATPSLAPHTTLGGGRYVVLQLIAQGGFAEVYEALDTQTGEKRALKVLQPSRRADSRAAVKLMQEAVAGRALTHKNLVHVHDHQVEDGLLFFVMERLRGRTLRAMLHDGPLAIDQLLDFAVQAANGLYALHFLDIFHRDVKPENLFVTTERVLKVLDLGAARFEKLALKTTRPKDVIGTAFYMSPEHMAGEKVDPRSDVYSLGLVVFEMVTGFSPVRRELEETGRFDWHAIHAWHNLKSPPPMKFFRPECPLELEMIVKRALQKKPEARYATAAEMSAALEVLKHEVDKAALREHFATPALGARQIVVDLRSDQTQGLVEASRAHTEESWAGQSPSRLGSVVDLPPKSVEARHNDTIKEDRPPAHMTRVPTEKMPVEKTAPLSRDPSAIKLKLTPVELVGGGPLPPRRLDTGGALIARADRKRWGILAVALGVPLGVIALLAAVKLGGATATGCDKLKQAQRESAESDSDEPSPKKKKKKKTADAAQSSASPRLSFETLSAAPVAPTGGKLTFTPEPGRDDDSGPKISPEADFTKDAAKKILPILRKAKSGALPAVEIHVMPEFVHVRLHEAKDQLLLRELRLEGDTYSDKGLVKPLIERQASELAEQEFEASSIDFEGLPKIAADAVRRVKDGKFASQIAIRRFLPFDRNVQIRVFVEDARGDSKFVDYDVRGAFKKSG